MELPMRTSTDIVKKAIKNPSEAAYYLKRRGPNPVRDLTIAFESRIGLGQNVFDRDWDLLIILDTCRVDALQTVRDEFEYIESVESIKSVGSYSPEWIANTFDKSYSDIIAKTAYITANPHSKTVIENGLETHWKSKSTRRLRQLKRWGKYDPVGEDDFGLYEPVWKESQGEDEKNENPRLVTDHGIRADRSGDYDRIILHYMPPHLPHVGRARKESRDLHDFEKKPWPYIRRTNDKETPFKSYLDTLRLALEEVEVAITNMDRPNTVITADHGEAFGEYGVFDHPGGSLHPHVKQVPWAIASATDEKTREPELVEGEPDRSVDEALEALGYL